MAQREREKVRRTAARSARAAAPVQDAAVDGLESRLRDTERERDRLRLELEAARARVTALEESRRQAASRIDWIIDSLHSLIDKDT